MKKKFLILVCSIAFLFCPLLSKQVALVGGTVIDVSDFGKSDKDIVDSVVLVDGERIVAAGKKGSLKIPEGFRVIDITGKYVIPGLIDGFGALDNQSFADCYLYMGVTSLLEVHGYRRAPLFEDADPSPSIYRFEGIGSVKTETGKMLEEIEALAKKGVKAILLHYGVSSGQLKPAVDKAHELGMALIGELGHTSYSEAIECGVDVFVHSSRYTVEIAPDEMKKAIADAPFGPAAREFRKWLLILDLESPDFNNYASRVGKSRVGLMPTLSLYCIDLPENTNPWEYPIARILDPEDIHNPVDRSTGKHDYPPGIQEMIVQSANSTINIERKYHEAGARYLAGSGTDINGTLPGISLHLELNLLTRIGLNPRQVLAAATNNFSLLLGFMDTGEIKVGKRADILVLDENPLADIKNLQKIHLLMLRGKIIDRDRLLIRD